VSARVKKEAANISITAQITNIDHLQKLLYKLEHLKEVKAVYRVTKREARVSAN
jgi:(p)ppGpp synthase/HD superfamily hydrolase